MLFKRSSNTPRLDLAKLPWSLDGQQIQLRGLRSVEDESCTLTWCIKLNFHLHADS